MHDLLLCVILQLECIMAADMSEHARLGNSGAIQTC